MKGYSFSELVALAEAALPATATAVAAHKLHTARTIGGVAFDGTKNINLPGVNTTGNQNTTGSSASCTGNAATATKLQTARKINGKAFDGTADITLSSSDVGAAPLSHAHTPTQVGLGALSVAESTLNIDGKSGATQQVVDFRTVKTRLIVEAVRQGIYRPDNGWRWCWDDGVLTTGTVPWARLKDIPAQATRWPTWAEVAGKPATMPPSGHTHPWSQVTGVPVQATRWPTFAEVTDKPSTMPPSSHTHPWSQITGAPAQATRWPTLAEIGAQPAGSYAAASHTHPWSQITGVPVQSTRWPNWGEVTGKPATMPPSDHDHLYLRGTYISGGKELPSYFGSNLLKLQMLGGTVGGVPDAAYSDALWMSSYAGADVKASNVLLMSKSGAPRIGFRQQAYDSASWGAFNEIYHTGRKPSPADIGAQPAGSYAAASHAHPWSQITGAPVYTTRWPTPAEIKAQPAGSYAAASHTHPWSQVTGVPVHATRWPSWTEVTGKPSTMPPSNHTHPWSQITGAPVYTTRWPTLAEIGAADRGGILNQRVTFEVGGDANTYYPVLIDKGHGSTVYGMDEVHISRRFNAKAPSTWNNSTHMGALTLSIAWSGDPAWGGNDHLVRVTHFSEAYSTTVAGLDLSVNGLIVWLRGGGAEYQLTTLYGVNARATVHLKGYTAGDNKVYPPQARSQATVDTQINGRMPLRGLAVYDSNQRVYSPHNKPTYNDVGAAAASHTHPWSQITGVPVQATRWPTPAEVGAQPAGSYAAASHTHPWSQITGVPVQATRWPTLAEIKAQPAGSYAAASHTHPWTQITGVPAYATRWPNSTEVGLGNVPNTVHTTASTANTVAVRDGAGQLSATKFLGAFKGSGAELTSVPWTALTSVPAYATRWPNAAEVGLSNVPNTAHTTADTANTVAVRDAAGVLRAKEFVGKHSGDGYGLSNIKFSSLVAVPVQATRWPNKAEVGLGNVGNYASSTQAAVNTHALRDGNGDLVARQFHGDGSKLLNLQWKQLGGVPATASRWPTLAEIGAASAGHVHHATQIRDLNLSTVAAPKKLIFSHDAYNVGSLLNVTYGQVQGKMVTLVGLSNDYLMSSTIYVPTFAELPSVGRNKLVLSLYSSASVMFDATTTSGKMTPIDTHIRRIYVHN